MDSRGQRALVGTQSCNTQGLAGQERLELQGAGEPCCLGRLHSLRSAKRHRRGLKRSSFCGAAGASSWGSGRNSCFFCWSVVQGDGSTSSSRGSCLDSCSSSWSALDSHRRALSGEALRGPGRQCLGHREGKQTSPSHESASCGVMSKLAPGKPSEIHGGDKRVPTERRKS